MIRLPDVKRLWGKSGDRCAICRGELTDSRWFGTLGEMCHIVARSSDGPRGLSTLSAEDRDRYANLILLCPTDHTDIDKNHANWTVEVLRQKKDEHEKWVNTQLSKNAFSIEPLQITDHLEVRRQRWEKVYGNVLGVGLSLTPLHLDENYINSNDPSCRSIFANARGVQYGDSFPININMTVPSPNGIRNENGGDDQESHKHSLEVFRNGHCEYFISFGADCQALTPGFEENSQMTGNALQMVRLCGIETAINQGIDWLFDVWSAQVPTQYMVLHAALINASESNVVYSSNREMFGGTKFGRKIVEDVPPIVQVIEKSIGKDEAKTELQQRLANSYGIWL